MALKHWILASRPKTLPAAICPVAIGTVMACTSASISWWVVVLIGVTALLIQIGANLANDYFDFVKGIDAFRTNGPERMTQSQKISPLAMRNAFILTLIAAFLLGLVLVKIAGWPLLVLGILSIIFAIQYTAGPYPLGYIGLGEVFVLLFFGPVAVGGTYYVLTGTLTPIVLLAGIAPGLISTGILIVNNLRDIDDDAKSKKKTLAVRFGRQFTIVEYAVVMIAACFVPVLISLFSSLKYTMLLPLLLLPLVIYLIVKVAKDSGPKLNESLFLTAQSLILYSLLFVMGWVLSY